ncbi:MAG: aspartate kinase [Eubacteriaceae bacterium]|jgi:aspartate kinase|nr:aspartate kinase [Eubacteriaceae bacterium]
MEIVVQKYGGTSVNKRELREKIVKNAIDAKKRGLSPVIVVSAMGRRGEPYATDSLLQLLPEPTKSTQRNKDLLISCGEVISCVIVAEEINLQDYFAVPLTGWQAGIRTNGIFGNSDIVDIDTTVIMELLEKGIIPVIAGFQGMGEKNEITTLGRGGSDITATALGVFLNAVGVEIYTDVDGVMTADPKLVDNAYVIDNVDYDEIFQLAEFGAKVLHPRAVEYAQKGNVPVTILNVDREGHGKGTLISKVTKSWDSDKVFTAITSKDKLVQFLVKSGPGYERVFEELAQNHISIDMISIFIEESIFVVEESERKRTEEVLEKIGLQYEMTERCSKITIVGSRIANMPGIIAKIMSALNSADVKVLRSTDSYTTVGLLIHSDDEKKAVKILHERIF